MPRLYAPTGLPPSQTPTGTVQPVVPIVAPPSGTQIAPSNPNALAPAPVTMAEPTPVIANAANLQFSDEPAPTHIYPEEEPMLFSMPPNNLVNGVNYNGLIEPAAFANPSQPFYLQYDMSAAGGGGDASLWATFPAVTAADLSGNKITNLGTPTAGTDAATKTYVDTAVSAVDPSTWSQYPATQTVDISTNTLNNVRTIATQDVSGRGLIISTPYQLSANDPSVSITGGASRADISNNGVNVNINKAIRSGTSDETISQLNFRGLNSSNATTLYNRINSSALNSTAGAETSILGFNSVRNGVSTRYLELDGSNNYVKIPNGGLDMSGLKITQLGTPTLATDAVTKAYVDSGVGAVDLSAVLSVGNSAGPYNINMNGNDISGVNDIRNASGEINISADDLNLTATGALSVLNIGAVAGITLTSAGAAAINAVGAVQIGTAGLISIGSSSDATEIEEVKFAENVISKTSGGSNLVINDIGEFNTSTPNSVIQSKAGIAIIDLSGLSDFASFQAQNLTATTSDVAGVIAQTLISTTGDAYGAIIQDIQAQAQQATGIAINGVSGTTASTAVSIVGPLTGTSQHGVYENATGTNVVNTFMNNVGVGKDPTVALDISGQTKIITATGGRLNPTLELNSTNADAPGTYLQFYHNSATPAVGDRVGVMDFYANNASAVKKEYARFRTLQDVNTASAEAGRMEMSVIRTGSMTNYFDIDGSNNGVIINPNKNITGGTDIFKIYDSRGITTNNTLMYADASNGKIMMQNYPQRYLYDISGDYTLTLPDPGWNIIRVLMAGGGGGGGSGRLDSAGTCYGGGAGSGGNCVECWYDRRELFPDASGALTLSIRVGGGGDGGAAQTVNATNGNNGAAGLQTTVSVGSAFNTSLSLYYQALGGNGGGAGTNAAGTGGAAPSFGGGNFGFAGRPGASSSITAQPSANTTGSSNYAGTICQPPGGSGAGGGVNVGATTAYNGGSMASPAGQYYGIPAGAGLGLQALTVGTAGTAIAAATGGASFVFNAPISTSAIRPLRGNVDGFSGGGGSINPTSGGGAGGGHTPGASGSRGSGGGGGGGATTTASGAGGRGRDGHVYITVW